MTVFLQVVRMKLLRVLLICLLVPLSLQAKDKPDLSKRIEVGKVKWGRDLDAALAKSKQTGRPVLVLFQEVPG